MTVAVEDAIRLIGLSFQGETVYPALAHIEKALVFGIEQILTFFTSIAFIHPDEAEKRYIVRNPDWSPSEQIDYLQQLGQKYNSDYVLYGLLEPSSPSQPLAEVCLSVSLFDLKHNCHRFQLHYPYTAFKKRFTLQEEPMLEWQGFQEFLRWLAFQILGAIQPVQALTLWPKISADALAPAWEPFKTLVHCHFLNDHQQAEKQSGLQALVQAAPGMFPAQLALGNLYKQQGRYLEAIVAFQPAFEAMQTVTPQQRAECATKLGVCYALLHQMPEACAWWHTAISVYPWGLHPYLNLAHAMEAEGRFADAERYFQQLKDVAPHDSRVYFNLARLYAKQEQWDKAIGQYERQASMEPNNPWAYSDLANCFLQKGDISEAKAYLLKTLEMDLDGEAGRCAHHILSGLQAAEV